MNNPNNFSYTVQVYPNALPQQHQMYYAPPPPLRHNPPKPDQENKTNVGPDQTAQDLCCRFSLLWLFCCCTCDE